MFTLIFPVTLPRGQFLIKFCGRKRDYFQLDCSVEFEDKETSKIFRQLICHRKVGLCSNGISLCLKIESDGKLIYR